jgi:hypothetical protein
VRRYLAINWRWDHDTDEIAGQAVEIAIDVCQSAQSGAPHGWTR